MTIFLLFLVRMSRFLNVSLHLPSLLRGCVKVMPMKPWKQLRAYDAATYDALTHQVAPALRRLGYSSVPYAEEVVRQAARLPRRMLSEFVWRHATPVVLSRVLRVARRLSG
jgi:hypothetical protein